LLSSVMITSAAFERILRSSLPAHPRRTVASAGLVDAGVLVPVLLHDDEPLLLFTRRTDRVETHKGQISFPGGVVDPGDADVVATALRETHEEIGVEPASVETLGLLDDLATPTGFRITPVVGILRALPLYIPNTDEVEEVFEAPVSMLLNPDICSSEILVINGLARRVWTYAYGSHRIWGATAYILRNLLSFATGTSHEAP
jgi:8-oxo-dGTP pyrophosphatase MutT (NUDIX family)